MPPAPTTPRIAALRVLLSNAVEHLRQQHRQHLRQQPESDRQQTRATDRLDRLLLSRISVLDRLGEQLRQHTDIRRRDRQHAGERSQPHRAHERQRPDELIHAAEPVEHAADREMRQRIHQHVARAEESQRQRDHRCDKGAEQCHRHTFREALQDVLPLRARARWDHLAQDDEQAGDATRQPRRRDVEPEAQRDQPDHEQQRTEPAQSARQQWRPKGAREAGTHARNAHPPSCGKARHRHRDMHARDHSTRPIANVRSFSDVRSIKLTARMISTMIAPISW